MNRGFTLIELLVALVLMSVLVGLTGLSLGVGEGSALRKESGRLASLIEAAQQQAVLEGRVIVVALSGTGYRFFVEDGAGGVDLLAGDELLRAYRLPAGMTLAVEGRAGDEQSTIRLWPTGEFAAFSLRLLSGGMSSVIEGGPEGVSAVPGA